MASKSHLLTLPNKRWTWLSNSILPPAFVLFSARVKTNPHRDHTPKSVVLLFMYLGPDMTGANNVLGDNSTSCSQT